MSLVNNVDFIYFNFLRSVSAFRFVCDSLTCDMTFKYRRRQK